MSKTILVVDDHDGFRELLKNLVEGFGYRAHEAANGFEAIESVKRRPPDMILMDLSMPGGMDGLTAARRIRQLPETKDVPMICITAYGEDYREEALAAGFSELLGKPFKIDCLKNVIERCFIQRGE
jgi:CheY-like chemotaxis protein